MSVRRDPPILELDVSVKFFKVPTKYLNRIIICWLHDIGGIGNIIRNHCGEQILERVVIRLI